MTARNSSLRQIKQSSLRQNNGAQTSQPRSYLETNSAVDSGSASATYDNIKDGVIELTKNAKYCVSKLPAIPPVLRNHPGVLSGSTDQHTCYSLVISERGAHVWDYSVPDRVPNIFFFPPPPSDRPSTLPLLGRLVSPIAGSKEPGLVIIAPDTGAVCYWEGVGGAIANDLLHKKKNISHIVKLYASEKIEVIENVEPAGIVATTSSGRFILITFRDSTGKPLLHSETMRGTGTSFLASLKGAVSLASSRRNVVSIRSGKSSGRDERQAILITDQGNLLIWECFRTGQARLLYEENLHDVMLNGISALYPHASETFRVHDVEYHEQEGFIYVITSFVNNSTVSEVFYILFTLNMEQDALQVVSTHRFQTYTSESSCQPRLFLPKPYETLFVLFSQAVVLIDSLPDRSSSELGLSRRWEDIITFLDDVEAFAFGKEDAIESNNKVIRHSGVIAMTKGSGVLRIERFKDEPVDEPRSQRLEPELAKTRIEQAVFYGFKNGSSNPLSFEARKEFQFRPEILENAFLEVSKEILSSTSPYLPPILPSLTEHLSLRWDYMEHLINYLRSNFPDTLSKETRLKLMANMEKLFAARDLWAEYDKLITLSPDKDHVLSAVVSGTDVKASQDNDLLRVWFINHVNNLQELLVQVAKFGNKGSHSLETIDEINSVLLIALPQGALRIREPLAQNVLDLSENDYTLVPLWTATTELIGAYESQYAITSKKLTALKSQEPFFDTLSTQLVSIVSTLCELYSECIRWCAAEGSDSSKREGLDLTQAYKERRGGWLRSLVNCGHKIDARRIAEVYQIYRTLVEILVEDLRMEQSSSNGNPVVAIGLVEKLREYIQSFGFDFAKVLYQYYIETKQLKSLLKQFPEFNEYLEKFFASGNYGRISWIHDLSVGKYSEVARTLFKVSSTQGSTVNQRLGLSIAKLSVLASGSTTGASAVLKDQIDSQMEFVNIKEAVFRQVAFQSSSREIPINDISRGLQGLALPVLISTLQRALTRLSNKKSISVEELIDILTLIDIDTKESELNFFFAFHLIALFAHKFSAESLLLNQQLVWRRLYLKDE